MTFNHNWTTLLTCDHCSGYIEITKKGVFFENSDCSKCSRLCDELHHWVNGNIIGSITSSKLYIDGVLTDAILEFFGTLQSQTSILKYAEILKSLKKEESK